MLQLIRLFKLNTLGKVGMILFHRNDNLMVLGKYDGSTFQGSDRLSMAVMRDLPAFIRWNPGYEEKIVVAEGDRFMNKTFIQQTKPYIIKITNDGVDGRRMRGSSQTPRQIKSIATRVSNVKADVTAMSSDVALAEIVKLIMGKGPWKLKVK